MQDSLKIEEWYFKLVTHRHVVGRILDNMLVKKHPKNSESLSMEDLLDWDPWPMFITIYSM